MLRSIFSLSLLAIILAFAGCGDDGGGNGNGPEPVEVPRLVAELHEDPGFQSISSAVWDSIAPESVYVGTDNDYNANVLFRTDFIAQMKALRTDTLIYIWSQWPDSSEHNRFGALMGTWSVDHVRWMLASSYDTVSRNEDRIYILFSRDGSSGADCSRLCHGTASSAGKFFYGDGGDNADIWQWKAHRTGLAQLAEDMHVTDTMISPDPQVHPYSDNLYFFNWNDFTEKPVYMHHTGPDYTGPGLLQTETPIGAFTLFVNSNDWMIFNPGELPESKQVPGYYLVDSTGADGSRWDVQTLSEFDGTHWTVVFRRKLSPDDPINDINFNSLIGDSVSIAVGLSDNSGIRHHGTEPFYLVFQ